MSGYERAITSEQFRHLLLRQPDSLLVEPHIHAHLTVGRFVNDDPRQEDLFGPRNERIAYKNQTPSAPSFPNDAQVAGQKA